MKSYDVLGYGFEGALYCYDCLPEEAFRRGKLDPDKVSPLFAEEAEEDDCCDNCGSNFLEDA